MSIEDTQLTNWLENQYGLHSSIDILYVVDGYEIEFMYDGKPRDGMIYHGETLRVALQKARDVTQTSPYSFNSFNSRVTD